MEGRVEQDHKRVYFRCHATANGQKHRVEFSLDETSCCRGKNCPAWKETKQRARASIRTKISRNKLPAGSELIEYPIHWALSKDELDTNPTLVGHQRQSIHERLEPYYGNNELYWNPMH